MRVHLRYFAQLREQLGEGDAHDVPAGTTAGALWERISRADARLRRVPVRFAVNETYVKAAHRLADGDELAVFPPVSGGAGPDRPVAA